MHYICNRITHVVYSITNCDLLPTNCTNGEAAMFRHFLSPYFSKVSFYFGKVNTINRKVNTIRKANAINQYERQTTNRRQTGQN